MLVIMVMMEGLCPGALFNSLSKNMSKTLSVLQAKADKYIAAEELEETKSSRRGKEEDYKRKEPDSRRIYYMGNVKSRKPEIDACVRDLY